MRHWQDIVGRNRLQLIDEIDYSGQFPDDIVDLSISQFKAREGGDMLDFKFR
jgi:hypothetical protein